MDMFGAVTNFATSVTGCVGKIDGLVDGLLNKALQESIGGVSSPGTIYITSPQLQGAIVGQLAPNGMSDWSNSHTDAVFIMMDPPTGGMVDPKTKRYIPQLKNEEKLKGVVAVCKRGAITLQEKLTLAQSAGCAGCLIIDKSDAPFGPWPAEPGEPVEFTIPCLRVRASTGMKLQKVLRDKTTNGILEGTISSVVTFSIRVAQDMLAAQDVHSDLDVVDYIYSVCEVLGYPLYMHVNKQRLVSITRRVLSQDKFLQRPVLFEQMLEILCRRPWCHLFPVTARRTILAARNSFLGSLQESASGLSSIVATTIVPRNLKDEKMRTVDDEKAASTPEGLFRRLYSLSNLQGNMSCADCDARVVCNICIGWF